MTYVCLAQRTATLLKENGLEPGEDFLRAAGFRFSASLVEDCIHDLPSVVEVAVVGIPDRLLGEACKA